MLVREGCGLSQPGFTSRSHLPGCGTVRGSRPEPQAPAGWWWHPLGGAVFKTSGDNTYKVLGTRASTSRYVVAITDLFLPSLLLSFLSL